MVYKILSTGNLICKGNCFVCCRLFPLVRYSTEKGTLEGGVAKRPMVSPEQLKSVTELPEAPTTCCMSGCANCVWIDYADKLSMFLEDGGDRARKQIMENVTDSNIRAFILMELRAKKTK